MSTIAIVELVSALLQLSSKYIQIAKQDQELTPEQEAAFKSEVSLLLNSPEWKIDKDPS
jgi:hypothetical protein